MNPESVGRLRTLAGVPKIRKALVAASFLALSLLLFMKNFTSDFGIHIATGRQIVESGAIPNTEFLCYPLLGQPMSYEEVGFQVPLYLVFKYSGIYGVAFFVWAMAFLAYLFLYRALRARDVRPFVILLTMLLFTFAFRIRLQPRPESVVYMFCAFLMYGASLFYYKGNRWIIWTFPPLFLLWANIHPSTIVGLGIVGAYGTQSLVVLARERFSRESLRKYLYIPLLVLALCFLASILSRHGVSSLSTPIRILTHTVTKQGTSELVSVAESSFYAPYKHLLSLAVLFGIAGALAMRIRIHDVITAIYGMRVPLIMARGVAFMSILTVPLVAYCADGVLKKVEEHFRRRAAEKERLLQKTAQAGKAGKKGGKAAGKKGEEAEPVPPVPRPVPAPPRHPAAVAVLSVFLLVMGASIFYQYHRLRDTMEPGIGMTEHKFSMKGAEFLRSVDIRGNMFNFFDLGGFLEWQLHPGKLTFIDGRGAPWPHFLDHQIVTGGMGNIESVFSKFGITYIVTKAADSSGMVLPLINYLAVSGNWELVFADGLMLVFVKNTPENRHIVERYGIPKGILGNHIVTELVHYTYLGVSKQYAYSVVADFYRRSNDPVNANRYVELLRETSQSPWIVQAMDWVYSGR